MMLFTFFLFGLVFVAKSASGGENPSCQVQTEKDKIIDLKQTQKLNKKAKLLRGLNSSSSSECQEECCGNSQCTLFVYHHRKESRHSCFLVSCSPESKCVYQQLEGSLVGHVSRPRPLAKGLVLSANDLTVSQPTVASAYNSSVQSSSPSSTIKISSQTTAGILSTTVRGSTPTELHSTSVTLNLGSRIYQESLLTHLNTPCDRLQEALMAHSSSPMDQLPHSLLTYSNIVAATPLRTQEYGFGASTSNHTRKLMSGSGLAFLSHMSPELLPTDVSLSPSATVFLSPPSSLTTVMPTVMRTTIITSPVKNSDIAEGMFENYSSSSLLPTLISVTSSVGENATAISDHNEKSPKKLDEHTTAASLVIALCFGILFLFAVVILIGRPWWDAFQRPRYSKVDYLMNGL